MRVGGVGGKSSRVELRGAWRTESKNHCYYLALRDAFLISQIQRDVTALY